MPQHIHYYHRLNIFVLEGIKKYFAFTSNV
jgi:hypothetical protein